MRGATVDRDGASIEAVALDLAGLEVIREPAVLRRRSRDFFWYSPVLDRLLKDKTAELLVVPRDEDEVVRVAAACARRRVPLTVRGAGTGNYGQAVPLHGGVVLDMTAMSRVLGHAAGVLRVEPGARMGDVDAALRPDGWELRMFPSTKRTATIGGFVAGGSGGVGSVTYGGLREPGNILAAIVVTLEERPRVIELRGDAAQKVNRAYGTTGVITALALPLAPAFDWVEVAVAFDDFFDAVDLGYRTALADGITKKLLSPIAWPLPGHFGPFARACPEGKAVLLALIAPHSLEAFKSLLAGTSGTLTHEAPLDERPGRVPVYEYTWNHTTLQALKRDRSVTYLQLLYPHDRLIESVRTMAGLFEGEVIPHLEFIRFNGRVTASALPVVRYTTENRLNAIIAAHEARGVMVANPHVVTLEDGSRHKRADADQMGFKGEVDPHGLLNPGKMRSYQPATP